MKMKVDEQGVTLLGAGELAEGALARAMGLAGRLVAVDGGAVVALAQGLMPELVVGDFDSITPEARAAIPAARQQHRPGQDDTDFDKALAAVSAPFCLAVGFTGARLDHTLAGMSTLARNPDRRVIIDSGHELCFLCPPHLALDLPPHTRLSLYPLRPLRCASTGLRWPTDGLMLDPLGMIGTSNETANHRPGEPVTLAPETPALLAMVPSALIDTVLAGVLAAPFWARR